MRKTAAVVLCALLAVPAWAEGPVLSREENADVDGDLKPERIVLEGTRDFVLRAGGAEVRSRMTGSVLGLELLELDALGTGKELLVHGTTPEGSPELQLFRWNAGALQRVSLPPGKPNDAANGIVLFDVPVGFWTRRDKYLYDARKPGFTEVPQPLYFLHGHAGAVSVYLTRETPLLAEPGGELLLPLPARASVTAKAFAPDPGARRDAAESGWYLVRVSGLVGWVRGEAITPNRPKTRVDMWFDGDTSLYALLPDTDLDGDGLGDVRLDSTNAPQPPLHIHLGKHRVSLPAPARNKELLRGLDLDFTDKYREVFLQGQSEARLVRFVDGTPRPVTVPECDKYLFRGDNTLMCVGREFQEHKGGTVTRTRLFAFDKEQQTFRERPQSLYEHYVPDLPVKKTFPLLRSRDPKAPVVARVAEESEVEVLVKSDYDGNGRRWFLVRSKTGLLGWTEVDTFFKSVYPREDLEH
jgi:hypothetical protein